MGRLVFVLVFYLLFLGIDWYIYRGLRLSFPLHEKPLIKLISQIAYWSVPVTLTALMIWFLFLYQGSKPQTSQILLFMGMFILFYVPKLILLVFNGASDLLLLSEWIWLKIKGAPAEKPGFLLTRKEFLRIAGTIVAALPFLGILHGIVFGRFAFRVDKKKIKSPKLSNKEAIRVVQISDAHLGSFLENKAPVRKAIEAINDLNPDIVVFTGDLVNDRAEEAEPWIEEFNAISARYGKFSILGNHDYGDYTKWPSKEDKEANLNRLKEIHREMGFDLLLNDARKLHIQGQEIYLAGVENWGLPPFPQHGKLNDALAQHDGSSFCLLLSHDPTHFDEEVVKHPSKPDLTLSGHTHGMQFGLMFAGFKWSPVQYRYKKWAGMYAKSQQQLYVNRGFGYIGFPGRVGMPPEISLFELSA